MARVEAMLGMNDGYGLTIPRASRWLPNQFRVGYSLSYL
jgi:hypothetical protein